MADAGMARELSVPGRFVEDEQALIERAKRDPDAFGELYDRYLPQIYRLVYSRVHDQTAAEDVTSEVFLRALRSIDRYRAQGRPFAAWLYRIAMCSVSDLYRSARPVADLEEQHDLAGAGPEPEEVAAQRYDLRRVWSAVETLPEQQRTAMVLKFREDMKIADIAAVMHKNPGAVKLLIHRGVTRVRQALQPTP